MIEILARSVGQLVTKDELMSRIWPGAVVMENTLQVHAAAVRKALGPYRSLLKTEFGRGYRLLGDWTVHYQDGAKPSAGVPHATMTSEPVPTNNFPAAITRLVGRSAAVQSLRDLVSAYRIVTLTGLGGIGKTVLALEASRHVLKDFRDGGWFVELASLSDPDLVPAAVAGALGLRLGSATISPEAVARAIGGKKILLLLDNCEHLIAATATLADVLVRLCPRVTIVATSREALRIEGEHTHRVVALEVPADEQADANLILSHSAPALFVARAKEFDSDFAADATGLRMIAAVCQQLDGIPLAIEFAAARAAALGIEQVAAGLRDRFALLTSGRRTALPRHRTLRATLDWSFDLLTASERLLLQRVAVFSGSFSLDAANAVAAHGAASQAEIADGIASLVAKSLVTSDMSAGVGEFRLLETTRAYALSKLAESGELNEFSRRHAEYCRDLLGKTENEWEKRTTSRAHLDNVRAALEWCFGVSGDLALGVGLAAAAAPVFLAMSLLPECHRWSARAILALDESTRGGSQEMHLQASLGVSSMQLHGESDAARMALSRSLVIAETCGDVLNQVGLLGTLSMFEVRAGSFRTSLDYAKLSRGVDRMEEKPAAVALANSILGRAHQFVGEHNQSRRELEASFGYWSHSPRPDEVYLGFDHQILVGIGLARNLWLQGYPARARQCVRQTIDDAERKNHPASLGLALSWAPGIFLWIGDLAGAEAHADWLISYADSHSFRPYLAVALGYKGMLAIAQGEASIGVERLRHGLNQLHAMRYEMLSTDFKISLVQGLVATGGYDEGLALADETIGQVQANGDLVRMPEALRVKGSVLLSLPRRRPRDAEACFVESLAWSRRQGARSWELRTAVDLAALWRTEGQPGRAERLLRPIYEQFGDDPDVADLTAARRLLATLS
jgi:predicted ATPase/DNA-binding winged helix-turn-helix (wHTH) protein